MKLIGTIAVATHVVQASQIVETQQHASEGVTPVSHVVDFLKGIQTTAENDYKKEKKLFLRFQCWAEHTIKTKKASNAVAQKRAKSLKQYIADIEAGKIEFTSERVDLEKELKELKQAIQDAKTLRETEKGDFETAQDEMEKTIAALDEAIKVLEDATKGHEEGVLVQVSRAGSSNAEGLFARAKEGAQLDRVSQLAQKVLSKGDAVFLQKLLSGEVPKADWKKLNRKATFKMAYKGRSFKIQEVLRKLKETVETSLGAATDKEKDAAEQYDKLMKSKTEEKEAVEIALEKLAGENGARTMNKDEAQGEVDALDEQVRDDTKVIDSTKKALDEKTDEWNAREKLRLGEIDAVTKAIEILSNDDARDLMTKSFKSQGYSFVQVLSEMSSLRQKAVVQQLQKSGRNRNSALVSMVKRSRGHFDAVIKAIDKMVSTLKKEEDTDLKQKEDCEKSREENTRTAALESRAMDELSDGIEKLDGEVAQIVDDIKAANETVAETDKQINAATEQRKVEHEEWVSSNDDDVAAEATVAKAKGVLETFYKDNGLMLMQKVKAEPVMEKPKTWEGDYKGRTEESGSIIAILEMIMSDIKKDAEKAKAEEDKAQEAFDKFVAESKSQIDGLKSQISDLQDSKAEKEGEIADKTKTKATSGDNLKAVMKTIADDRPGCDFLAVNYPMRLKNRQVEIDGLVKAKALLLGGEFNVDTDGTRELKPGDAFLQKP